MNYITKIALFVLVTSLILSCGKTTKNEEQSQDDSEQSQEVAVSESENLVEISRVDNSVQVLVNDSLIFESEPTSGNPNVELSVDLDPFINSPSDVIKIVVFNGFPPYIAEEQNDVAWEVGFSLILSGDLVDSVHESERDNRVGEVYAKEYIVSEWDFSYQ